MSLDDFPRYPLTFGPSPIHPLPRLSAASGRQGRDLGQARGLQLGHRLRRQQGAQARVPHAEALAKGCDTLVSIGGVQSNHTRQVTGVAAHLGLKAVTVQEAWVDWPDVGLRQSRQHPAFARSWAATCASTRGFRHRHPRQLAAQPSTRSSPRAASHIPSRPAPRTIRSAAWASPTGLAKWAAQEAEHGIFFDHIVVCTVTGSTHAGMIAGFALEDRADRHVIGIDASATMDKTTAQVTRIAQNTAAKIGLDRELRADEITLVDGYSAGIYGIPDAQTIEAIHVCARMEGMLTDPVYEGKSMAGLIGMIRSGEIPAGSKVLYAHLGGQPCLPAYAGVL